MRPPAERGDPIRQVPATAPVARADEAPGLFRPRPVQLEWRAAVQAADPGRALGARQDRGGGRNHREEPVDSDPGPSP